ncbi:MAG: hypothetical protein K8S98_11675 [Planctomycetes bacterium]|nr:hypothetical protein [Planctomycetota bacterium]
MSNGERLEFHERRARNARLLVTSLVLCAGAALLVARPRNDGDTATGIAGLALFGVGAVLFARRLLRRGPRLVFDQEGLEDWTRASVRIRWEEIERSDLQTAGGIPFLRLWLRNPERSSTRPTPKRRWNVFTSWRESFGHVSIPLSGLDRDAVDIAVEVARRLAFRTSSEGG